MIATSETTQLSKQTKLLIVVVSALLMIGLIYMIYRSVTISTDRSTLIENPEPTNKKMKIATVIKDEDKTKDVSDESIEENKTSISSPAQALSSTGTVYSVACTDTLGNLTTSTIQTDKDNVKINGDLEVMKNLDVSSALKVGADGTPIKWIRKYTVPTAIGLASGQSSVIDCPITLPSTNFSVFFTFVNHDANNNAKENTNISLSESNTGRTTSGFSIRARNNSNHSANIIIDCLIIGW